MSAFRGCYIDSHVGDYAGDNVALVAASARGDDFAGPCTAAHPIALIPVLVLGFAADENFIHFDNAHKLAEVFVGQARADAVAHAPCRAVRAETHCTINLVG